MEYGPSDSSGTDDDLPPTHQNRAARGGRVSGNGRTAGAVAYPRVQNDMEAQIHRLEKEAYGSILRAFKAQSDAISWDKEGLITELRKELRMSDEDHRELLSRVNADDTIRRIREWRQSGGYQSSFQNNSQPVHDAIPSPTISASRKRQKMSQPMASLSVGTPSAALHPQLPSATMQPTASMAKKGSTPTAKGKKPKLGQTPPNVLAPKAVQYPPASSGRDRAANRSTSGAVEFAEGAVQPHESLLIGRKVRTRWPEDNNFYEAVITDYKPEEGRHALVYDINTNNETWEWVDLKEISPDDIQWVSGEDPGISRAGQSGLSRGNKKPSGRPGPGPGVGRGRGSLKTQPKKGFPPQNGIGRKSSNDIEILHTEAVIREVERVFNGNHPDPLEMEKAKKMLKDHEQSLVDAIARLADVSDGESEEGEHLFSSQGPSTDRGQAWRNQHGAAYADGMVGAAQDGSDGDPTADDI